MAPLLKVLVLAGQSTAVGQKGSLPIDLLPQQLEQHVYIRTGPEFAANKLPIEGPLLNDYYDDIFGPEVGMGLEWNEGMKEKDDEDELLVVLKTAAVGSLWTDWRPPGVDGEVGRYYNSMMTEIEMTVNKLTSMLNSFSPSNELHQVEVAGVVWMVGYEDAHRVAEEYASLLSHLLRSIRNNLNQPMLPMVVTGLPGQADRQALERRVVESMEGVAYTVLDLPSTASVEEQTLAMGRQVIQELHALEKGAHRRLTATDHTSFAMLIRFRLDPRLAASGDDCDDFVQDLIRNSYNEAASCMNDASCQAISAVNLNEELVSYASLSGDGFIESNRIDANVRFDVSATGSLSSTLFSQDISDGLPTAMDFVDVFNINLASSTSTCAGAILMAEQATDLIQESICSTDVQASSETYRLSFRLKDTTESISDDQLTQLTNDFNKLAAATYNEVNALNLDLCDPFHQEASLESTTRGRRQRQETLSLMDRPLERSMRRRMNLVREATTTRKLVKDASQIKSDSVSASAIKSDKSGSTKTPRSTKNSRAGAIVDTKSSKSPKQAGDKSIKSSKGPSADSSKSTKSIKSGEATAAPTMSSGGISIPGAASSLASFTTGCVGTDCASQDIFSDSSSTSRRDRQLAAIGGDSSDLCLCPDGDQVEARAPTQEEFQALFDKTFADMQASGSFSELACVRPGFAFNATIVTEVEVEEGSELSDEDIMSIGQEYLNQYNQLNVEDFCDPFARSISSFTFTTADITSTSRRRQLQFDSSTSFLIYYTYTGSCTNCGQEQGLYDDTTGRRELQQGSTSSDTCLCNDPTRPRLTEGEFATRTNDTFAQLFNGLPPVRSGEVLTGVPPFECPTGAAPRFVPNFFELQGNFFGLDLLDLRVELNEYNAPCMGSFPVTGVKAFLLEKTPNGPVPGDAIPTMMAPLPPMFPKGANFVVRFQMNLMGLNVGRKRLGFVLETNGPCGMVLGPKQVSLTPDVFSIICIPAGTDIMPPPLTQAPTPMPTPGSTNSPTSEPTGNPTSIPTSGPTGAPTSLPTSNPTGLPTSNPTGAPTSTPTGLPTSIPTSLPTSIPTGFPTSLPTSATTSVPTPSA